MKAIEPSPTDLPSASRWQWVHRLMRKHLGVAGGIIIILLTFVAVFAPVLAPYDPLVVNAMNKFRPPGPENWLGTDAVGRDILSRILYGTRISLFTGVVIITAAGIVGMTMGLISGYFGGKVDNIIMRLGDVFLAFPQLILAMAVVAALGPGLYNAMAAIAVTWWPQYARLVRSEVLAIRQMEYVEAAEALGAPHVRILISHVLPNALSSIMVKATMDMGVAVLFAASLSFIGFGVQPPTPEWGAMVSAGRTYVVTHWWVSTVPGMAIFVTVMAFNLLGDALRDVLDPRLKGAD